MEYVTDITAVRKKELPELDDEWANSLGEANVEAVRTKLREDLKARATAEADHNLRADVMRKLVDAHPFEVPQSLVEQQTDYRLEEVANQMARRGVDPRKAPVDWKAAREELRTQAEQDVRATMLMEKIAEAENITVSEEEVEAEIESYAAAAQQSIEQVRAALTKNGGERSIAQRLRNRKALDLLIENARVTDAEWTEPKEAEDAPEEE